MSKIRTLLWCLLILGILPLSALAKPEPIIPTPPEYILDKQLEGEDPFEVAKPVFSPDNAFVAAFMHSSKNLTVWDTKTGKQVASISDSVHGMDALDGLEFTSDGKQLILMRNFLPLKFVDWKAAKVTREIALEADPKKILSYAFSPDNNLLAVGTYTGIALWDMKSGKKIKDIMKNIAISGLDIAYYHDKQGKLHRILAFGRAVMPPDLKWKDVVGLIDLDTYAITPLLNDVPADKKVETAMSFFFVSFEFGAGHVLATSSQFPPTTKASAYLIDTWTGKYISQQSLGQPSIKYTTKYLWKPFYGFVLDSNDMTHQGQPYNTSLQFVVPTYKEGLKILDTVDESKISAFGIRISPGVNWAAIAVKKDPMDTCKLYLYKVVPKTPPK